MKNQLKPPMSQADKAKSVSNSIEEAFDQIQEMKGAADYGSKGVEKARPRSQIGIGSI